jgi:hypothetical protein
MASAAEEAAYQENLRFALCDRAARCHTRGQNIIQIIAEKIAIRIVILIH